MLKQKFQFLFLGLLLSTNFIYSYTEKTFLSLTNSLHKPTTLSFDSQKEKPRFLLEVTPFYKQSMNKKDVGKYFGVNDKDEITFGPSIQQEKDIYYRYLIKDPTDHQIQDNLKLEPSFKSWGVELATYYNIHKKLFIECKTQLEQVTTNLHAKFLQTQEQTNYLQRFFAGTYEDNTSNHLQAILKYAKIKNKQKNSGLADIQATLGLNIINEPTKHFSIATYLSIPTGKKPNSEYLFEPIYGNNHHLGLGLNISGNNVIWDTYQNQIFLHASLDYQYLFSNNQMRTLGIKGQPYGHYYLLAEKNQVNQPLKPAANILSQKVEVFPGSQLTLNTAFSWHHKSLSFKWGYQFFTKEEETIKHANFIANNTYAIASPQNYETNANFGKNNPDPADFAIFNESLANKYLKNEDLDISTAQSPSSISHKFFIEASKSLNTSEKFSYCIALGTSYSFISQNSGFDFWESWFKAYISF